MAQTYETPRVAALAQQFANMSSARDEASASTTTGNVTAVDGGYVQEIVSRSSPRRRYDTNDAVATVTTRRVFTSTTPSEKSTPPRLRYADTPTRQTSQAASPATPGTPARPPERDVPAAHGWRRVAPSDIASTASSVAMSQAAAPRPEPRYDTLDSRSTSARVAWRSQLNDTREIEPSRQSPLHVTTPYAPVRYMTKRELRRLRGAQAAAGDSLPRHVRSSSVPRLDAELRELNLEQPRVFHDPTAATVEEHMFRAQPPIAADHGRRPSPQRRASPQRSRSAGVYRGRSMRTASTSSASTQIYAPTPYNAVPGFDPSLHVTHIAEMLAMARGLPSVPSPPAYVAEAFRLLQRGTYLVKYTATGNPHERYLAVRVHCDDAGQQRPYLVWSVHAEAVSFKDRLPLVNLADAVRGPQGGAFARHAVGPGRVSGPFVGSSRSVLTTEFTFTLVFRSNLERTVSLLARDDQTYRCWLLVCDYFAAVNLNEARSTSYRGETMNPDSPRSVSAASYY